MNGGGIYAMRPREGDLWSEGADVRFTRTKDQRTIYAFALKWPGERLLLRSVQPSQGSVIQMLGTDAPLKWTLGDGGVEIRIPDGLQDESRHLAMETKPSDSFRSSAWSLPSSFT